MEKLKEMKEALVTQVQGQMGDLRCVNTHELGEVIDMIKDLEESMYYHSITKAMEEKEDDKEAQNYYLTRYLPAYEEAYRDVDRSSGRMYYTDRNTNMNYDNRNSSMNRQNNSYDRMNNNGRDINYPSSYPYPMTMRDSREGRSPMSRKTYMESKEMHQDKAVQMKELENYMGELSQDITEMIQMASPEEKAILQKKLNALSSKIV